MVFDNSLRLHNLYRLYLSFYQSINTSYETTFIPSQGMTSFHTHIPYLSPSPYKESTQCNFLQKKTTEISQGDNELRLDSAKGSQRLLQIGCFWLLRTPKILFEPLQWKQTPVPAPDWFPCHEPGGNNWPVIPNPYWDDTHKGIYVNN